MSGGLSPLTISTTSGPPMLAGDLQLTVLQVHRLPRQAQPIDEARAGRTLAVTPSSYTATRRANAASSASSARRRTG